MEIHILIDEKGVGEYGIGLVRCSLARLMRVMYSVIVLAGLRERGIISTNVLCVFRIDPYASQCVDMLHLPHPDINVYLYTWKLLLL